MCVNCSKGFWKDANGACNKVNPDCRTINPNNGFCTSCYPGFIIAADLCVVQDGTADPNCQTWDKDICANCSKGFYFDSNNVCTGVDPFCKTFDFVNLVCTDCYSGFSLANGACEFNPIAPVNDPNCNSFDTNGGCLNCSTNFYFDANGVCVQVDPSCRVFNFQQLICLDCYSGYTLTNQKCIRNNASAVAQTNCAEELQGVCIKCVARAYYDINNNCVMASTLCRTFNTFNGFCTSCYTGYALDDLIGKCLPSQRANCKTKDPNTNVCTECTKGNYLDTRSVCQVIDPNCQNFDFTALQCTSCFKGYQIGLNNACILTPVISSATVQNCVNYDLSGSTCLKCFSKFYISNNQCIESDPLCKTFDLNGGACLTCYTGFTLQSPKCVFG